ncbi:MAG TPA: hypothetical protein VLB83_04615 [Candidatus Paceibacterota bacterium]|nr:hypothetical protein [Candidatus Paceibacterota bacterium]
MDLIKPPPPKGIYEKELHYVEGELKASSFGSADNLTSRQVDEVMDKLRMSMDPDTAQDMRYGFKYVSAAEVTQLISQIEHDADLKFTPKQMAHVKKVLQKYLDIDRHPSMFSL